MVFIEEEVDVVAEEVEVVLVGDVVTELMVGEPALVDEEEVETETDTDVEDEWEVEAEHEAVTVTVA